MLGVPTQLLPQHFHGHEPTRETLLEEVNLGEASRAQRAHMVEARNLRSLSTWHGYTPGHSTRRPL